MTAAVVSIVLLLVGLPLVAFWLGGRRFWSRLRPGRGADPWGYFMREHRLTAAEAATVSAAVHRGRRLDDERLRRAAADLARQGLAGFELRWRNGTRTQRVLVVCAVVWVVSVASGVVVAVLLGDVGDVPWFTVITAGAGAVAVVVFRRRLRRAVELNSGPPPS